MSTINTFTQGAAAGPDPQTIWRTQPSVRKVVSFIARNVAALPWHAYRRNSDHDRERLAGGRVEQAFLEPSPGVTGYAFMRDLVIDLLTHDSAAAWLVDDELRRIPPQLLRGRVTRTGELVDVGVQIGSEVEPLAQVPHVVLTGWAAAGGFGTSPLETLAGLLAETDRAVEWRRNLWDRAAKFGGLLKMAGKFRDPANRARFKAEWAEFVAGRAGSEPILEEGMEYETVTPSVKPADARDIEGRQLTDAEVAAAYHVPPELVGAREGTFSNVTAYRRMLYGPVLGPLLVEIEQGLNASIVPALAGDDRNVYLEAHRDAALNGSLSEQAEVLSTAVGGPWMTRAEARGRVNLPRLDGADKLIVPLNVTAGGLASPRSTATPSESRAPRAAEQ